MNYGQAIKQARTNLGLRQNAFAEKLSITQSYLSRLESGDKVPSTELIELVAKEANLPIPIMLWYAVTEEDVSPLKRDIYKELHPVMNNLIQSLYDVNDSSDK